MGPGRNRGLEELLDYSNKRIKSSPSNVHAAALHKIALFFVVFELLIITFFYLKIKSIYRFCGCLCLRGSFFAM